MQMKKILLCLLFSFILNALQSQNLLDNWYCEGFGHFEPFEYDETNDEFTFRLKENCDPNYSGHFKYLAVFE